jgi:hypothetical protein
MDYPIDVLKNLAPNSVEIEKFDTDHYLVNTDAATRNVMIGRYQDHWIAKVEDADRTICETFTGADNPKLLGHALNGYLHATLVGYSHE